MAKRSTRRAASSRPRVEKQPDTTPNGKQLGGVTGKGFMPGKSGNPNGRTPLAVTLAQHFRDIGSEIVDKATGWTRIDVAIRRLFMDAAGGKTQATELILDRGWGKVTLPIDITIWQRDYAEAIRQGTLTLAALTLQFGLDGTLHILSDIVSGGYMTADEVQERLNVKLLADGLFKQQVTIGEE